MKILKEFSESNFSTATCQWQLISHSNKNKLINNSTQAIKSPFLY